VPACAPANSQLVTGGNSSPGGLDPDPAADI
jgi:hypothetical protein